MKTQLLPRTLSVLFLTAAVTVSAGTLVQPPNIFITSLAGPGGVSVTSSPFNLPDGTSQDGLSWTGTGASLFTFGNSADLSFFGTFTCASFCVDAFAVNFNLGPLQPGSTAVASMFGSSTGAYTELDWFPARSNSTIVQTFSNSSGAFNVQSAPVLVSGNFSGQMFFLLQMGEGRVTLPPGATADLVITNGATAGVPEPATLAILAACALLLIYVKRLRRA